MGNIPDFVLQIQEAERNLKAKWQMVQNDWRGQAANNFNSGVMEPYTANFHKYITGDGIRGCGVDDLMKRMDKHMQAMAKLSGVSEDVAFACAAGAQHNGGVNNMFDDHIDVENLDIVRSRGGVVHNSNRDRDYWNNDSSSFGYDGAKPGELNNNDIEKIMQQKR